MPLADTTASKSRVVTFSVVTSTPVVRENFRFAIRMAPRTTTTPVPTSALRVRVIRYLPLKKNAMHNAKSM